MMAFRYDPGVGLVPLTPPAGYSESSAVDVNSSGIAVGYGRNGFADFTAAVWDAAGQASKLEDLVRPQDLAGHTLVRALAVSDAGHILVQGTPPVCSCPGSPGAADAHYLLTPIDARNGTVYCTAGISASGCQASISSSGLPSANSRWTAKPAHNPGSGAVVQAQLWYRDPLSTSNQTTSLSDAIEFTVAPWIAPGRASPIRQGWSPPGSEPCVVRGDSVCEAQAASV